MHSCSLDVSIHKLSKIEGHADLDIKIRRGKVKEVNLRVGENQRFFEQAVKGQDFSKMPQTVSRICGTCSLAHLLCSIEAVEKALKIKPSRQTIIRRKLLMYSLMIRDHALHLYFFSLPDVLGIDSVLDLPNRSLKKFLAQNPALSLYSSGRDIIHEALHVKEAGNKLSELIGGRSVHAPWVGVGGFSRPVEKEKIKETIKELRSIRKYVKKLAEIYYQVPWRLERETDYVALVTPDFSFLEGKINSSSGLVIKEEDFWDHLHRVVIPYSQASGFEFEGKSYLVGALARVNLNKNKLHPRVQRTMKKYLKVFPSRNVFHNNLAQAIEIAHSIEAAIDILESFSFKEEKIKKSSQLDGEGVGVIEAPRGTLYYWVGIDKGKIRYTNLVIPTAQNLLNMKNDVKEKVIEICECGGEKLCEENIRQEVEKIIRAYDPCMSCASHFLKVRFV